MKLRVGILGCASIARRSLAPAFLSHPAFELVAVGSRSYDKAKEFAGQFGARPCSYENLVESDDIDLVYCPLPTGLHHVWVKKCLLSGKHVLCEKSLACSVEETEDLVGCAKAKGLFLMESFQFRFHAQNLYVRELLSSGVVGNLRQIAVRFGIPPFPDGVKNIRYSKELGGGALLDNGAYTVKCATYLLGHDVRVVAALHDEGVPELGNVDLAGSIMMASGNVPVQTSYGFEHFYQNSYEIWGDKGKITTERAFTARPGFAAPVTLETSSGREVKTFDDDHFARLLDYVAVSIEKKEFEAEYEECLTQARLLSAARKAGGSV